MRQVRSIRYREIAEDLLGRMDQGDLAPGQVLPSEAALGESYNASRVTVRKALEELRKLGRVDSRQGFGWFVAPKPVTQRLAHLGTIEAQLEDEGRHSKRQILDFEFVDAPERVRLILGVDRTLKVRRLNLADGEPFAIVTVWCPEELGKTLTPQQVEKRSFYENLSIALTHATQTIGADAAGPGDAELLGVPVGSPVLVCRRMTRSRSGAVVLLGEYVFPAHRTEFIVELTDPAASIGPSGLRLVE